MKVEKAYKDIFQGGYSSFPIHVMLLHHRVTGILSIKILGSHLHTWAERGTVKVAKSVLFKNTTQ